MSIPRYSHALGEQLQDLVITGRIYSGLKVELYQVYSERFCAALACKLLRRGIGPASRAAVAFRREATVLEKARHPHIVRCYEHGRLLRQSYLLMELLMGPSLFRVLTSRRQRRLTVDEALRVTLQMVSALRHLHDIGYLHCDVKPANIMFRQQAAPGEVPLEAVLLDMDATWRLASKSAPRSAIGTDPYMAPEQCLRERPTPATDVYGLGATLFEMLTGRWPFQEQLERDELRWPQIRAEPPAVHFLNPEVPPALEAVIARCLARSPHERYPDMSALGKALLEAMQIPRLPAPQADLQQAG